MWSGQTEQSAIADYSGWSQGVLLTSFFDSLYNFCVFKLSPKLKYVTVTTVITMVMVVTLVIVYSSRCIKSVLYCNLETDKEHLYRTFKIKTSL